MRPGRLNVHVQDLALGQAPSEALVLEAEVPGMGTVRTPPSSDLHWSKGVTLDLGPSHGAVLIVRLRTLDGRVLAKGSTTLEWTDSDRQVISVDLDGSGGSLSLQLRYFHCRAPGARGKATSCFKVLTKGSGGGSPGDRPDGRPPLHVWAWVVCGWAGARTPPALTAPAWNAGSLALARAELTTPVRCACRLSGPLPHRCSSPAPPARTGKERDELGRELVDELLIQRHSSSFSGSATETGSAGASPRAALEETRVPLRPRRGRPEATCA